MKRTVLALIMMAVAALMSFIPADNAPNAGAYMGSINIEFEDIQKEMWDYTRAVAHNKSARKIDKRRTSLLSTIASAQKRIARTKAFEGDVSYRNAVVDYLTMNYNILNQDYAKIVDLEAIAEQSYDMMEAYLMAQEAASTKMKEAGEKLDNAQKSFAKEHDITLTEGTDKRGEKLEEAGKVFNYYNKVYLIFFKSFIQESFMLEAQNAANLNEMEQNKGALNEYANQGIKDLAALPAYKGDKSLKLSCHALLKFYADETSKHYGKITNFYLKKERFEQIQKSFEAKSEKKRTQADVDQYNNALKEYNAAIEAYNSTNELLNKERSELLDRWNKTVKKFTSTHVSR